ncbi:tRNA-dihydrouridine synthase [Zooshikella sp. RANM57]|uniref:tRNA-dihydrouridine synthase n=1 Tax=Zooshikella sp. RANM57 TaxID=3425863 RepID=UPI003D6F57A0
MRVFLAPMEGVVDYLMRDLLTSLGGIDLCITEFVRVVDQLLPARVFYRLCPELHQHGRTHAGVPVRVQLLGQHPEWLATNAQRAVELGSPGIDLNFGCPARTVNNSRGGAILLTEPEGLYRIVAAVRSAVPNGFPVSVKMRLGYEDKTLALENACAVASAGATEIIVHARTKTEGYRPPAHWHWLAKIKSVIQIPLIANGEIWTDEDARQCQILSHCHDLMIGRGALALPNLPAVIKKQQSPINWSQIKDLLWQYTTYDLQHEKSRYYPHRIKQWLGYLRLQHPEAQCLFERIKRLKTTDEIVEIIKG